MLQVVRDVALRKETVTSGDRVTKLQNYEDDEVLFECVPVLRVVRSLFTRGLTAPDLQVPTP